METSLTIPASMPVLSMEQALARRAAQNTFIKEILTKDLDFGVIPGAGKPTLLKPGAEKLLMFFGLRPRFVTVTKVEDWTGRDYQGEPFFYYHEKCVLSRDGGVDLAEGDGSCNSRESKYRYRQGERVCPECGKPTIIKGKAEYGGGWICFAKKGGCGAKFRDGDQAIEGQQVGRVLNPDVADLANTILKMAQKRALVAATLIGVNASEFFTQDIEDLPGYTDAEYRVVEPQAKVEVKPEPKAEPKGTMRTTKPTPEEAAVAKVAKAKPEVKAEVKAEDRFSDTPPFEVRPENPAYETKEDLFALAFTWLDKFRGENGTDEAKMGNFLKSKGFKGWKQDGVWAALCAYQDAVGEPVI